MDAPRPWAGGRARSAPMQQRESHTTEISYRPRGPSPRLSPRVQLLEVLTTLVNAEWPNAECEHWADELHLIVSGQSRDGFLTLWDKAVQTLKIKPIQVNPAVDLRSINAIRVMVIDRQSMNKLEEHAILQQEFLLLVVLIVAFPYLEPQREYQSQLLNLQNKLRSIHRVHGGRVLWPTAVLAWVFRSTNLRATNCFRKQDRWRVSHWCNPFFNTTRIETHVKKHNQQSSNSLPFLADSKVEKIEHYDPSVAELGLYMAAAALFPTVPGSSLRSYIACANTAELFVPTLTSTTKERVDSATRTAFEKRLKGNRLDSVQYVKDVAKVVETTANARLTDRQQDIFHYVFQIIKAYHLKHPRGYNESAAAIAFRGYHTRDWLVPPPTLQFWVVDTTATSYKPIRTGLRFDDPSAYHFLHNHILKSPNQGMELRTILDATHMDFYLTLERIFVTLDEMDTLESLLPRMFAANLYPQFSSRVNVVVSAPQTDWEVLSLASIILQLQNLTLTKQNVIFGRLAPPLARVLLKLRHGGTGRQNRDRIRLLMRSLTRSRYVLRGQQPDYKFLHSFPLVISKIAKCMKIAVQQSFHGDNPTYEDWYFGKDDPDATRSTLAAAFSTPNLYKVATLYWYLAFDYTAIATDQAKVDSNCTLLKKYFGKPVSTRSAIALQKQQQQQQQQQPPQASQPLWAANANGVNAEDTYDPYENEPPSPQYDSEKELSDDDFDPFDTSGDAPSAAPSAARVADVDMVPVDGPSYEPTLTDYLKHLFSAKVLDAALSEEQKSFSGTIWVKLVQTFAKSVTFKFESQGEREQREHGIDSSWYEMANAVRSSVDVKMSGSYVAPDRELDPLSVANPFLGAKGNASIWDNARHQQAYIEQEQHLTTTDQYVPIHQDNWTIIDEQSTGQRVCEDDGKASSLVFGDLAQRRVVSEKNKFFYHVALAFFHSWDGVARGIPLNSLMVEDSDPGKVSSFLSDCSSFTLGRVGQTSFTSDMFAMWRCKLDGLVHPSVLHYFRRGSASFRKAFFNFFNMGNNPFPNWT